MTPLTDEMRTAFRQQGFVVVPDVLSSAQIARGRAVVETMLAAEPHEEGHVGPYFLWPRFGAEGHPLLDFYRDVGVGDLAAQLLRPELPPEEPDFAQLATTVPPWPHWPGGPHVDGLRPGQPAATFSLLAGVWLTDQVVRDRGNLWIWPRTHLGFGRYLAERGADALTRLDEMNPGPYPKIDLGEPTQATGTAGSVLLAHYLLAHNIGGHEGSGTGADARRETVYYRVQADGHSARWRDVVVDPLVEFRP